MKVSEITTREVASYIRLAYFDLTEEEDKELNSYIEAAKAFIKSYTGLSAEEIDTHDDFVIVMLILIQDMYDNGSLYVDKNNLNALVDSILGMHRVNLL